MNRSSENLRSAHEHFKDYKVVKKLDYNGYFLNVIPFTV